MVNKSGTNVLYITYKDPYCGWRLRGKKKMQSEMFEITVYNDVHTCSQEIQEKDHHQVAPWVVGHLTKRKFATDCTRYMANNKREDMKHHFGVEIRYEKAWRCREKAFMYVRGTCEDSYSKLLGYLCQLEQKNLGTISDFKAEDGRFLYFLFSIGVSRRGFWYCHPVICVDDTFLKNKYGGHMLCVVALDANNHLFRIVFGLVGSEDHNSWTYFMRKLQEAIGDVENLAFVSDRHASITHALEVVFSDAYHGRLGGEVQGVEWKSSSRDFPFVFGLIAMAAIAFLLFIHFGFVSVGFLFLMSGPSDWLMSRSVCDSHVDSVIRLSYSFSEEDFSSHLQSFAEMVDTTELQ
ncbi:uncharacterized protein LOC133814721 [Humulus lupulus]|uniref:uncharacterized protein LOC133814721 n=1 Tax=Humulus lupulus TaxID=3486 RepID=UPI002B40EBBC|nr:uncharacterized protein LOC133814721 [Humulus lupulus]